VYWRHAIRSLVRVSAAAGIAAVLLMAAPSEALACSPLPGYNINQNDVIAEGWVENVEIAESPTRDTFLPVRVTLRVLRSWKGQSPARILFTDQSSYVANSAGLGGGVWSGSSGACGALDVDPTGKYGLVVFKWVNGELATSNIQGAVFGDGPTDPLVDRFRRYVEDNVHPAEQPRVLPDPEVVGVDLQSGWQALAMMVLLTAAATVVMIAGLKLSMRRHPHR
jgi:hypothetical protein